MVAPFDDVQRRRDARFLKRRVQQFALVQRHDEIRVAVDDEAGRVTLGDVGDRIRPLALLRGLFDRLADQAGRGRVFLGIILMALDVVELQKVRRTTPRASGLDG